MDSTQLKQKIRNVPDFPKKGIQFKDITPVLQDGQAFKQVIDAFAARYSGKGIGVIASIESRGFILGAALAYALGCGFVPVRKAGKLPYSTIRASLVKEYGEDVVEVHTDAFAEGQRVLIVDDVLATGGTLKAAVELVEKSGAIVEGIAVLVELSFLNGRKKITGNKSAYDVYSLVKYDSE